MTSDRSLREKINEYRANIQPDHRYASFDYCYGYFQSFQRRGETAAIAAPIHLRRSCMELGFYLASWGMFRGNTQLLQRSAHVFRPLIRQISRADPALWKLDADRYDEDGIHLLLHAAGVIRSTLAESSLEPTDTLVTKIMLGVFGSVPAFDTRFRHGLAVHSFSAGNLRRLGDFYMAHRSMLDSIRIRCLCFDTGRATGPLYPKAKLIDMYGFMKGGARPTG